MFWEEEEVADFVRKRLGRACVYCNEVIYTQSELSLEYCDPCCKKCASVEREMVGEDYLV